MPPREDSLSVSDAENIKKRPRGRSRTGETQNGFILVPETFWNQSGIKL